MTADQLHQVSLQGIEGVYNQPPVAWQTSRMLPDQLLVTTQSDYLAGSNARVLLSNDTLTLYAVSPADIDRALLATNLMRSDNRYAVVTDNLDAQVIVDNRPVRWFVGANTPQPGDYPGSD